MGEEWAPAAVGAAPAVVGHLPLQAHPRHDGLVGGARRGVLQEGQVSQATGAIPLWRGEGEEGLLS